MGYVTKSWVQMQFQNFSSKVESVFVKASSLAKVATSGKYTDLTGKPTIPTVGNGTITIKQAGTVKGTFTVNQTDDITIELTDSNTKYTLPLSSATTRGGVKVGYTENGKNYPVELSNEQMFVNVPWTDNDTWKANSASSEGYVTAGSGHANQVWKTDANGNPAWRDDKSSSVSITNNLTATIPGTALDAVQGKVLNDKITQTNSNLSDFINRLNDSGWISINNYLYYRKWGQVVTIKVLSYVTKSSNWETVGFLPFNTNANVYGAAYDGSGNSFAAIFVGGTDVKIRSYTSGRSTNAVITIVCE